MNFSLAFGSRTVLEISFLLIKNKSTPESWNEIWGTLHVGQLSA